MSIFPQQIGQHFEMLEFVPCFHTNINKMHQKTYDYLDRVIDIHVSLRTRPPKLTSLEFLCNIQFDIISQDTKLLLEQRATSYRSIQVIKLRNMIISMAKKELEKTQFFNQIFSFGVLIQNQSNIEDIKCKDIEKANFDTSRLVIFNILNNFDFDTRKSRLRNSYPPVFPKNCEINGQNHAQIKILRKITETWKIADVTSFTKKVTNVLMKTSALFLYLP